MGLQVPSNLNSKKSEEGNIRQYRRSFGAVSRELALQKECNIIRRASYGGHVHLLIAISPKCAVSQVIEYIKGKRAIPIARKYAGRRYNNFRYF